MTHIHTALPPPQRHGAYLYRTLGFRLFDSDQSTSSGCNFTDIPAGWAIALGDADDRFVTTAHPWQSPWLVFANGETCATRGSQHKPDGSKDNLERDGAKLRPIYSNCDVLLFKSA